MNLVSRFRHAHKAACRTPSFVPCTALISLILAPGWSAAQSAPETSTLPTIVIQGNPGIDGLPPPYAGGQIATGGDLGILGSQNVLDVPFSTLNYTAEMLEDIQARTLADVILRDASVQTTTAAGGFSEDFMIRGFAVTSGDTGMNGLYGLLPANRVPMEMVERVELLKGPGTLMRGIPPNGGIGGNVNIVTKRAQDEPLSRLTASYSSTANVSTHLDIGRRFGEQNAWGVRFNGVLRGGEASIRDGNQKLGLGALALDYRGSRLRWSLDAIYQDDAIDDFRAQVSLKPGITEVPAAPDGRITFFPDTHLTQDDRTVASRLEYDITDHLSAYAALGYRDNVIKQVFPMTVNTAGSRQGIDADGNFHVKNSYYDSYTKTYSGDAGLKAHFETGGMAHALTLGATRLTQESGNGYSQGTAIVASNIYDPSPLPPNAAVRQSMQRSAETTLDSVALADTLSFAQDRILLTLGARYQTVTVDGYSTSTGAQTSHYKASATSPVAGLVIKPLDFLSVYANYTAGLTRGSIVGPSYANAGETLAPYKSKQYEAGIKADWGKLTTTLALYQLSRPSSQADDANVYGYFGEQRNRGLELSAYGEILPSLSILASANFVQGTLTQTPAGKDDGNTAPGVPKQSYRLGLNWDTPWAQGLSLNGRIAHTSSVYLDSANTVSLPSVTTYGLGARYDVTVAGKPVVLRADVDNLTDKQYWLASGTFMTNAAGRRVMLSASMDF